MKYYLEAIRHLRKEIFRLQAEKTKAKVSDAECQRINELIDIHKKEAQDLEAIVRPFIENQRKVVRNIIHGYYFCCMSWLDAILEVEPNTEKCESAYRNEISSLCETWRDKFN